MQRSCTSQYFERVAAPSGCCSRTGGTRLFAGRPGSRTGRRATPASRALGLPRRVDFRSCGHACPTRPRAVCGACCSTSMPSIGPSSPTLGVLVQERHRGRSPSAGGPASLISTGAVIGISCLLDVVGRAARTRGRPPFGRPGSCFTSITPTGVNAGKPSGKGASSYGRKASISRAMSRSPRFDRLAGTGLCGSSCSAARGQVREQGLDVTRALASSHPGRRRTRPRRLSAAAPAAERRLPVQPDACDRTPEGSLGTVEA